MTLTDPIVSQAIIFFTRAFCLESFITLIASEAATIVDKPSGTAATIRAIADIKASEMTSKLIGI